MNPECPYGNELYGKLLKFVILEQHKALPQMKEFCLVQTELIPTEALQTGHK